MISTLTGGYDNEEIEGGIDFIRAGKAAEKLGDKIAWPDTLDGKGYSSAGNVFIVATKK